MIENQYCIQENSACLINDIRLIPYNSLGNQNTNNSDFFNLNELYDIEVRRDAENHPLVNLKLAEKQPCINPNQVNHVANRPLIELEFGNLNSGCPIERD